MKTHSDNTQKHTLYLHIFPYGSCENTLHRYLHNNISETNLSYSNTQYDIITQLKSHAYLSQLINKSVNYESIESRNYYVSCLKTFWKDIAKKLTQKDNTLISLRNSIVSWDIFWKTAAEVMDISTIQVQAILPMLHQEDSLEFFYRLNMWHSVSPESFQPTQEKYNYLLAWTRLSESAHKYGIPLCKPHVLWKPGHTDADEQFVVQSILHSCGLSTPESIAQDNTTLKSHDCLRFAALTLPPPFPFAFQVLGVQTKFCADAWQSSMHQSVLASLRQGEMQGLFSLKPLSPASMRKKALELGQDGNDKLCRLYPEISAAMQAGPENPVETPNEPVHTLSADNIEKCIHLLSVEQKQWISHCMETEFKSLTDEQICIKQHLNHKLQTKKEYQDTQYVISVLTLAYNAKDYIAQNIESIIDQQCSVPIQHIIVDDGSDDDTQNIIESYARRFAHIKPVFIPRFPRHNGGDNVKTLFGRCHTKYAAICDGDDYFTDPHKLQKQYDFLEKHAECALCFHPVNVTYEDGSPTRTYPPENILRGGVRQFYSIKDLLFANFMQTNSVMYRWRFTDGLPDWFDPTLVPSDWYWHLLHAETGLIGYLKEHMSVYRRHAASLYASAEGDHVDHRAVHGLNELRTYNTLNRHFKNRHYDDFCRLAMGVLADFVQIYMQTGDDSLIQKGISICPEFGQDFLKKIQGS
ncbi:MAG: glycosyltransferase [Desulfovibrio sp.]|uniref:glycosyltransferase family 2 protein n=1 Tax=Desulfovibrio sp. TaxID=885 RepID=UPI00135D1F0A|nr:glycosyltransferase [Desulfovibrio sp.]MTJ92996.1 glycosyltransferase [Desulfovibrio sp.]